MGRAPCCEKVGLKKGPWTPEEDQKLVTYIHEHGHGSWRALPQKAGLLRCGKSCRLRWANYLRPDIKRGKFSVQEEQTIIQLHALLGNRWSAIATHLPKRTDNEIKNYWNTHLKKRLVKMGIDPVTHKPQNKSASTASSSALVSHMAQWESARLEAETRLVRESKLRANASLNAFNPLTRASNPWRSFSSGHGFESPTSQALGLSSYSFDWMKAVEKFDKAGCNWTNETVSPAETSYVGLLQQAMCPSAQATKLLSDETKKIVASHKIQELSVNTDSSDEKKPILENAQSEEKLPGDNSAVGNSSSARSDVSELSKTDGDGDGEGNGDGGESPVLKEFQHSSSDEISSNVSFKSHYDGLSTDILMDLVIVPSTSADDTSLSTISGGLCTPTVATDVDDTKDYWSNMFIVCNSPHTNHSGVQSMF
ncbi:hypothetical protein SUGI_0824580 [Cryptomeria japonica]|uniref:MYB-like transcription factor 4 n=1 Tax=Cryptomeria japonica TaxID=3369 RepID=UPI002414B53D|nr:MYB-like transcription factor 4 [Cryptomeria japonica]GLJ40200.1 hypothetical protein SUGI_0824580 [Cryptomeria japonica]